MLKSLDVVALTVDLPDLGLRRGNVGTVVEIYGADAFEIEFVDDAGRTYELTTVTGEQLLRLQITPAATAA